MYRVIVLLGLAFLSNSAGDGKTAAAIVKNVEQKKDAAQTVKAKPLIKPNLANTKRFDWSDRHIDNSAIKKNPWR